MQPVEFPQQTAILAKDQPQYTPLPVHVGSKDENFPMTSCLELNDEEIAELIATRKLWHTQITFGHPFQPVRLSTQNPFEEVPQPRLVSPIDALVSALKNDDGYRETWKANLAMAFVDEYKKWGDGQSIGGPADRMELHLLANKAADNFLNTLCAQTIAP